MGIKFNKTHIEMEGLKRKYLITWASVLRIIIGSVAFYFANKMLLGWFSPTHPLDVKYCLVAAYILSELVDYLWGRTTAEFKHELSTHLIVRWCTGALTFTVIMFGLEHLYTPDNMLVKGGYSLAATVLTSFFFQELVWGWLHKKIEKRQK